MILYLTRYYTPLGTFGAITDSNKSFEFKTLERLPLNNKKNESCIPEGWYRCERIISPRFGETFEVSRVMNRTHIVFHWGNFILDYKGCIGIGMELGVVNNQWAITDTKKVAFPMFMEFLKDEIKFDLKISRFMPETI